MTSERKPQSSKEFIISQYTDMCPEFNEYECAALGIQESLRQEQIQQKQQQQKLEDDIFEEYRHNIAHPLLNDLRKQGVSYDKYLWLVMYGEIVTSIKFFEDYPEYFIKFCSESKDDVPKMHQHLAAKKVAYENLIQRAKQINQFMWTLAKSEVHMNDTQNYELAEHIAQDKQLLAEAEAALEAEAKRLDTWSEV